MSYIAITHSGRAHLDEILAIAAIAAYKRELPDRIDRFDPKEIAETVARGDIPENAWVVDSGLVHDPERRLFDHHQDRDLPSAALMVFRHLFPGLEGTDVDRYFDLVSRVDTRGMRSLGEFASSPDTREYLGFGLQILTRSYEVNPMDAVEVVSRGLRDRIDFEKEKKEASEWINVEGRLVERVIAGVNVLEYTEQPPADILDGLKAIDSAYVKRSGAAVVYGYDRTDAGIRTLYRTEIGHEVVDFTKAAISNPVFCHPGGFLARFRPADAGEWKRLIAESALQAGTSGPEPSRPGFPGPASR